MNEQTKNVNCNLSLQVTKQVTGVFFNMNALKKAELLLSRRQTLLIRACVVCRGVVPFSQRKKMLEKARAKNKKPKSSAGMSSIPNITVGTQVRRYIKTLPGYIFEFYACDGLICWLLFKGHFRLV